MSLDNMKYDYFIILDFEATTWSKKMLDQEIIEFPSILVRAKDNKIISEFESFVKPIKNPILSNFCKNLKTITQDDIDNADEFKIVFINYLEWLSDNMIIDKYTFKPITNFTFITGGDWDLKVMLPKQFKISKIKGYKFFDDWINIKNLTKAKSCKNMLSKYDLVFEGTNHRGIDDCRNIYRVLCKIIDKIKIDINLI